MDLSANNTALWSAMIQIGLLLGVLLLANVMVRKIGFFRKSLMPTAVLAGFIVLILRMIGLESFFDTAFMEAVTYHAIALGFIAMSLRAPEKENKATKGDFIGLRTGAMIVSTYLVQALLGLAVSIGVAYTIMPGFFKAAGLLLPMGYGQGPGQANNIGSMYQGLGFEGGHSFGLSIAAAGYLCACVVGVIYINVLVKKGKVKRTQSDRVSGSVTVDVFQEENEIPISESVDRFSMQLALVFLIYLLTFLVTWGLTSLLGLISEGLASSVSSILWGFNFIVGSVLAMACRGLFSGMRKAKIMTRQYTNNYLMGRISGFAFDLMVIAGIGTINISDLQQTWLPFVLMAVLGGAATFAYLQWICKKLYPNYFFESFVSMYGMLTGTISSGVLLLREIDPGFKTPAANNLLVGSGTGIIFGAPLLILLSMAPQSDQMLWVVVGLLAVYLILLLLIVLLLKRKKSKNTEA